jgi:hypothetical protein
LVLVCHQVNDFAIAPSSPTDTATLIAEFNTHVTTTSSQGSGVKDNQGIGIWYNNGVNVHQTHAYIKLSCETYILMVGQSPMQRNPVA